MKSIKIPDVYFVKWQELREKFGFISDSSFLIFIFDVLNEKGETFKASNFQLNELRLTRKGERLTKKGERDTAEANAVAGATENKATSRLPKGQKYANFKVGRGRKDANFNVCHMAKCDECGIKFANINLRNAHERTYHLRGSLQCQYCSAVQGDIYQLLDHEKRVHLDQLSRLQTAEPGTVKLEPADPIPPPVPESEWACSMCGLEFTSLVQLERHCSDSHTHRKNNLDKVMKKKQKCRIPHPVACDACGKTLLNRFHLAVHMRKRHRDLISPCRHCYRTFLTADSLSSHMAVAHRPSEGPPCDKCGKRFRSRKQMLCHMNQIHYREDERCCGFCGKLLGTYNDRIIHEKTIHKDMKRFVCAYCGVKFARKRALEHHTLLYHEK